MANIDSSNKVGEAAVAAAGDEQGDEPSMTPIIVLGVLFSVVFIAAVITWRLRCKSRQREERRREERRRAEEQRTTSQHQEDTDVELGVLPTYVKEPPPPPPAYRPSTTTTTEDEPNTNTGNDRDVESGR